MKKQDRELLNQKLKTSHQLMERGQKVLCNIYFLLSGYYSKHFIFFERGKGTKIWDVDGNEYLDFVMGIGPLILGHAHPIVEQAAVEAIRNSPVHGLNEARAIRLAELLVEACPSVDMVTLCNSGTEATMHALKLARAYTGKDKIAKFEGCYHGSHDCAQISGRFTQNGSIEDPISTPDHKGIPKFIVDNVLTLSINHPASFDKIRQNQNELAAVIVEPMLPMCPVDLGDYLRELRRVTEECNVLLIFDEVITGFRLGYNCAQGYYGINPDLTTFGKIIGGGFPVGAVGGAAKYMQQMQYTPVPIEQKVVLLGTFDGNPVTCAAGIAVIEYLKHNQHVYTEMEQKASFVKNEMEAYARKIGFPFQAKGLGSVITPYFTDKEIKAPRDSKWRYTAQQYNELRMLMLKYDICLSDMGAIFLSAVHSDADCEKLVAAFKKCLDAMY